MSFLETVEQARAFLERIGRVFSVLDAPLNRRSIAQLAATAPGGSCSVHRLSSLPRAGRGLSDYE